MRYVFHSHINAIKERRTAVRSRKTGNKLDDGKDEVVVDYESLGWFIFIAGFPDSIGVGDAKPEWETGQKIKITIEDSS
jgi:hypothetical protein